MPKTKNKYIKDPSLPLVSVAMPSYNHEEYIEEAIESVLGQNYPNIQLVISDDASTDKSPEILQKYADKYPDVIDLLLHPENLGIPKNIATLYPRIKGKYISWFASDDVYFPHKIKTQVEYMEANPNLVLSYHDSAVITPDGRTLYTYNQKNIGQKHYEGNVYDRLILRRCFISGMTAMVNTEVAGDIQHRPDVSMCSDWLMFTEMAKKAPIGYIPQILGQYRRHEKNVTKRIDIEPEESIYIHMLRLFPHDENIVRKGMGWLYTNYTFKYLFAGQFKNAWVTMKKFFNNMKLCPDSAKYAFKASLKLIKTRINLLFRTGNVFR